MTGKMVTMSQFGVVQLYHKRLFVYSTTLFVIVTCKYGAQGEDHKYSDDNNKDKNDNGSVLKAFAHVFEATLMPRASVRHLGVRS